MVDVVKLQLGSVKFEGLAMPQRIVIGGSQRLAVHELVGGARVVDALGRQDAALAWSGRFQGADAVDQANALDALRVAGTVVDLTWHRYKYSVIVEQFTADFEQWYEVPYRISCLVVSAGALAPPVPAQDANAAIASDAAKANALAKQVGDPKLEGLMGPLNDAMKQVQDFARATRAQVQSVLQPLAVVRAQVTMLVASATNAAGNLAGVGGFLPTNPAAQAVNRLGSQLASYTQLPVLNQLQAVTGRLAINVQNASGAGQAVPTVGGNLMKMATTAYNDVTAWTGIARANHLTDPVLQGVQTVTIPRAADNSGGLLG